MNMFMEKLKNILKKQTKEEKKIDIVKLQLKNYLIYYFNEIFEENVLKEIFPSYFLINSYY